MNDNAAIWWVIKGPVLASIMVSYQYSLCVLLYTVFYRLLTVADN